MLILLPPSETKRPGGRARPLDLGALALPSLAPQREAVIDALVALSADADEAARVLKLGATQRGEIAVNAALRRRRRWPAIDRYTGRALRRAGCGIPRPPPRRRWLGATCSSTRRRSARWARSTRSRRTGSARRASLPGVAAAAAAVGGCGHRGARGSAPALRARPAVRGVRGARAGAGSRRRRATCASSRRATDGAVRALNHFNKHAKGALVRRLAEERPRIGVARRLRAVGGCRGPARARERRPASSSSSPEPGYAGVRTAANRLRRRSANPRRS